MMLAVQLEFFVYFGCGKMTYIFTWPSLCAIEVLYITYGQKQKGNRVYHVIYNRVLHGGFMTQFNANAILYFFVFRKYSYTGFPSLSTLLMVYQIGRAVDHIHEVGVIHRDVKMENILIGQGKLKINSFI